MSDLAYAENAKDAFLKLQSQIGNELLLIDPSCHEIKDEWNREEGGGGITRVFSDGKFLEKGGVNFSDVSGSQLPPSATLERPELNGLPFRAIGVSVVFHPHNPYIPTSHANVRYFQVGSAEEPKAWWFGGGFDLTPYYPFHEDVISWHKSARSTCLNFGEELYPKFKKWCDEYFYLPHRKETRGVGGIFFDDFKLGGFENSLNFARSVGETFCNAYFEIFRKRMHHSYGDKEKDFQKYRRGRYAEFNLVYDRGTLFGLQSAGRIESILMSMPPEVSWKYNWHPEKDSAEEKLYSTYLKPCDWLGEES